MPEPETEILEVTKKDVKKKNVWSKDMKPKKKYGLQDKIKIDGYYSTKKKVIEIIEDEYRIDALEYSVRFQRCLYKREVYDLLKNKFDYYLGQHQPMVMNCKKEKHGTNKHSGGNE